MIKRTEINKLKTPKISKGKQDYTGKGSVDFCDYQKVSASATPKPGMGKGKARGMGAAEFGGKFSGIY
tara:strand:+ start:680 stop:883 length:204 start_codon:yes stop_codon:yes gene_type:complete